MFSMRRYAVCLEDRSATSGGYGLLGGALLGSNIEDNRHLDEKRCKVYSKFNCVTLTVLHSNIQRLHIGSEQVDLPNRGAEDITVVDAEQLVIGSVPSLSI